MATSAQTIQRTIQTPRRAIPWGRIAAWTALVLLLIVTLFPFFWMLRTALTYPKAMFTNTGSLLPVQPSLINFQRVLGMIDTQTAVALGGTGQSINFLLALRNQIFGIYIAALMVPAIVMTIPNFILVRNIGALNSFVGIVAPAFLMTPFAVFFLRQFFLGINREVEEAALIDGASIPVVFFRVVLPMTVPAITTLAVIVFISSWNNYLWPLIIGNKESVRVLTVALGVFRTQTPQGAPDWSGLMAGTAMAIVPTFLIFVVAGRKILDSIQFTGFK